MNLSHHTFNESQLLNYVLNGEISSIKSVYEKHTEMFDANCVSLNFVLACLYNQLDTMKFFHSLGADIEYYNGKALIYAIQNNNLEMINYLVDNNINLHIDKSNHSLSYACATNNINIIHYFYNKGCTVNNESLKNALSSSYFTQEQKIDIIIFLLEHSDRKSIDLDFALTRAISEKNLSLVRYLVENGANVNNNTTREKLNTPLQTACFKNSVPIVQYLVEQGADINANEGWALQISCRDGHLSIVKYLVEQGADISLKNNYALKICMKPVDERLNLESIIYYLVSHGADVNIDDGYCFFVEASKKEVNYNVLSFFIDYHFVMPSPETQHYSLPDSVKQWFIEYLQKKEFSERLENELNNDINNEIGSNEKNKNSNINPFLEKKLKI